MCTQTVSLIAAEIQRHGIATTCIVLLRDVAKRVRPPRALAVPFRHGYPLGEPHNVDLQRKVIKAAFALLESEGPGPVLEDLRRA